LVRIAGRVSDLVSLEFKSKMFQVLGTKLQPLSTEGESAISKTVIIATICFYKKTYLYPIYDIPSFTLKCVRWCQFHHVWEWQQWLAVPQEYHFFPPVI
jgi:hypothetical protein